MSARSLLLTGSALAAVFAASPAIAAPQVLATVKPLHSLVAGVMEGVGEPELLIEGAASPHGFSLRPSDAVKLENAEIVFWIGHDLETFLEGPLQTLAPDATSLAMMEVEGMTILSLREGGLFEPHVHDHDHDHDHDHGHDDDDDHGHEGDHDHDHDHEDGHDHGHEDHEGHGHHDEHRHDHHAEHAHETHEPHDDHDDDHGHDHDDGHDHEDGHDHDHDHDHDHNGHDHDHEDHDHGDHAHAGHDHGDAHIWLDPQNARLMVAAIVDTLARTDPENAETYNDNGQALAARLSALEAEIADTLAGVEGQPFFVFHDAYHYFEARFGIEATGTFTVNPEIAPGAGRLSDIREVVETERAVCLFSEPQFSPQVIQTIAQGTGARMGELDPLGADIEDGPELYFQIMRNLADTLAACLTD